MDYRNPLILNLTTTPTKVHPQNPNVYNVNVNSQWATFKRDVGKIMQDTTFDYIALHIRDDAKKHKTPLTLDIMTGEIAKQGTAQRVPVISKFNNVTYQLNLKYSEGESYIPSNKTVLAKYKSYDEEAWQKHQSDVWSKVKDICPLKDGKYGADHKGILTAPSRGLSEDDLERIGFFSLQPHKTLNPELMEDDFIGMPGIDAKINKVNFFIGNQQIADSALSLSTLGSGYVIPMRNANGDMAKFQIGADVNAWNLTLKARAKDGITIKRSEYYDKKQRVYTFEMKDGGSAELKVVHADNNEATFEDVKGQFKMKLKSDIKPFLESRGYVMPPLIDKLTVQPQSKYNWPAPGNMVGTNGPVDGLKTDVPKLVSPSNAGFIKVSEPKEESFGYNVLLVEGALKGHIVATYLNHADLHDIKDEISSRGAARGLIVAQTPGVSKAFIESMEDIYNKYDIKETVIAMDADGRYNASVAKGIHDASDILGAKAPVRVMSWNPDQKGLDDALIALSRKEITREDFGLTFGSAEELFPINQAQQPNPYHLDGTRANRISWVDEYTEKRQVRDEIKNAIQQRSKNIDTSLPTLDDLVEPLGETATPVVEPLGETATPVVETLVETATPVVETLVETATPVVEPLGETTQNDKLQFQKVEPEVMAAANDKLKATLTREDSEAFMKAVSELSNDFYNLVHDFVKEK